MPLQFATVQASGLAQVQKFIQKLPRNNSHPLFKGVTFDTQNLGPAHSVYVLAAADFANGALLDNAVRYSGYRYLVRAAGQPYMAAEVHQDLHNPGKQVVNVNIGQFVGGTARALVSLPSHGPVMGGNFEVRLLRSFTLYFMAIWLKGDAQHGDLIYPLSGGAPVPFQPEQIYTIDAFRKNLQLLLQLRQKNTAQVKPLNLPRK